MSKTICKQIILFLSLLLTACETTEVSTSIRCDIEIESISPETLLTGETATIVAYPLTEVWDSLVEFNGVEADVSVLNKDNCEACEECRTTYECTDCSYCSECQDSCIECTHSLDVIVPQEISEQVQVVIFNAHGSSDPYETLVSSEEE
jgi:hypothetical protein